MESYGRSRPLHRLVRRTAATRPLARLYGVIQTPLDRLVYRLTRGRTTASSWLGGVEITMLTTTGARSGRRRTLPVLGLLDGEEMIVIASNFGRPRNPSWYYNLRANPRATIVVGGTTREVVARELRGAERERDYRRGEEIYPGFTHYLRWAANREIPVLRLAPLVSDAPIHLEDERQAGRKTCVTQPSACGQAHGSAVPDRRFLSLSGVALSD